MKKQTAGEWLQQAMSKKLSSEIGPYFLDLFEQAKAMEKEQIIDAFIGFDSDTDDNIEVAQAYYKEFYGK